MESFDPIRIAVRNAHFIGGRYVEGGTGAIDVKRPSDGVSCGSLPVADADLVDQAGQDAWRAFRHGDWASRAPRERARVLRRWADLVEADVATLAPLEAVSSTSCGAMAASPAPPCAATR